MVRIFEAQNCDRKNLFELKISFHQLWHVSNGKKALIWNVHFCFLKCYIKHWEKYQNIEMEKYRKRDIRKSRKLANSFSCLWTFAETGCNSASSPNLKWTARSPRFPTGASLALSRWPPVLSSLISLHCSRTDCAWIIQSIEHWRWGTAPACSSCGWRRSTLSQVLEARTTPSGISFFSSISFEAALST